MFQADDSIETLEAALIKQAIDAFIVSHNNGMFHVSNKERSYISSATHLHTALGAFIARGGKPTL